MIPLYPDPTLESTNTDLGLQQREKDLYMPEPLFHALQKLHIQHGEELYFELITHPPPFYLSQWMPTLKQWSIMP